MSTASQVITDSQSIYCDNKEIVKQCGCSSGMEMREEMCHGAGAFGSLDICSLSRPCGLWSRYTVVGAYVHWHMCI